MVQIPLGALSARPCDAGPGGQWSVDPDGLSGRGLVQPVDVAATYDLMLDGPADFAATVCLFPHDWRDGVGILQARLTALYPAGARELLWSAEIATARAGGDPRGVLARVTTPHSAVALALELGRGVVPPGPAVARGVWMEPSLSLGGGRRRAPVGARVRSAAFPSPLRSPRSASSPRGSGAPLISVLTPVHDPPLAMLREAVESVLAQTFTDWELCLVDDGSADPQVIAAVQEYAAANPRIRSLRRDAAGGISEATNAAIELASGEYVALLDHDDTLEGTALARVAELIDADPTLDMVYTDEDIVLDGRAIWTHLKPGWSPDTLRTNGYTCHLGVYRRSLVQEIGGFRAAFNGSQDIDMILRLIERTDRVGHVPEVLYHWRMHVDSTAGGDAKPYAYVAAARAIAGHLERLEIPAQVEYGPPGLYRVVHEVDPGLEASIVLAVADEPGLARAAAGWLAQPHPSWRVVCAAPADTHEAIRTTLDDAGVPDERVALIDAPADTDPAAGLATAARSAHSEQLLLCQYPAAGLTHDWLTRLIGYSHQPGIGAAGPIILTPDGLIQEAGIAIPHGIPLPLLQGRRSSMDDFFGYGTSVYNVAAVSGMLATSRTAYEQLDGLRPEYGPLSLIDYCLRARAHHLRTVIVPDARLTTTTPHNTPNDLPALRHLHATHTTPDPYYNARYRDDRGDWTPRVRL
jgi:GT2 family glycosyltransferase